MRIIRWVLIAVVLLVVVVLALPFLLPTSVYKEQIIEQTRLATVRGSCASKRWSRRWMAWCLPCSPSTACRGWPSR